MFSTKRRLRELSDRITTLDSEISWLRDRDWDDHMVLTVLLDHLGLERVTTPPAYPYFTIQKKKKPVREKK